MSERRRGRPSAAESEPRAYIRWINGRAYAELGSWAPWGGRRQEPLVERGEKSATREPNIAAILFAQRLMELREKRAERPAGTTGPEAGPPTSLGGFIGFHLGMKAEIRGRRRASSSELALQETRLLHGARFFRDRGIRDVRQIDPASVEAYAEYLRGDAKQCRRTRGRCPEFLSSATQRKYLDALGNMLKRAKSKGIIRTNPVEDLVDKPTAESSPTEHLELWEAALLLEAARRLHPMSVPGLPIYPLLAWELLTGCIESEAKSREINDLRLPGDHEFPHGVVMVRTNVSRDRLKTDYRVRYLSLQPQLAEIMGEYLAGAQAPKGRLLFPGASPEEPIGRWEGTLEEIAALAGFEPGEVRCIRFRPTFATHRAYTCDETGHEMTALKLKGEMGHGSLKMLEERYFKNARFRRSRPQLEYRWSEWAEIHRARLAGGIAASLTGGQDRALWALTARPMAAMEWAGAVGMAAGTFFPVRARLESLELIVREGEGRGSKWGLTVDGHATIDALRSQRALAA